MAKNWDLLKTAIYTPGPAIVRLLHYFIPAIFVTLREVFDCTIQQNSGF